MLAHGGLDWVRSAGQEADRQAHAPARSVRPPSALQASGDQLCAEPDQSLPLLSVSLPQTGGQESQQARFPVLSIERAIQWYMQEQREAGRSPKTMEWHQTALALFQQYLVRERHLSLLCQITVEEVRGWVAYLQTTPSTNEKTRSASTIATYARSARAFCHWVVCEGYLEQTPFGKAIMPKAGKKVLHLIEPGECERLFLACRAGADSDASVERMELLNYIEKRVNFQYFMKINLIK